MPQSCLVLNNLSICVKGSNDVTRSLLKNSILLREKQSTFSHVLHIGGSIFTGALPFVGTTGKYYWDTTLVGPLQL